LEQSLLFVVLQNTEQMTYAALVLSFDYETIKQGVFAMLS